MPAGRRVLTGEPVHRLAQQVRMPGVAAVLLDQVEDEPAQADVSTVLVGCADQLVETPVGQRRVEALAGALDGAAPEGVQLVGAVVAGRAEGPVGMGVPVDGLPRGPG